MGTDNWSSSLLGRLRRAVKKIKFLLNYNVNRWRIASRFGASSSSSKRRLSFNDRFGLKAAMDDDHEKELSGASQGIRRTISNPLSSSSSSSPPPSSSSSEDDIDKRAEAFIANFYRQLQYERQISLELRYARGHSFSSSSSP